MPRPTEGVMRYELFHSTADSLWYWHTTSSNNEIMGRASEGYANRQDAYDAIMKHKARAADAQVFEVDELGGEILLWSPVPGTGGQVGVIAAAVLAGPAEPSA